MLVLCQAIYVSDPPGHMHEGSARVYAPATARPYMLMTRQTIYASDFCGTGRNPSASMRRHAARLPAVSTVDMQAQGTAAQTGGICMCVGMCVGMRVGMRVGMCVNMCADMCADMCIGICVHMCQTNPCMHICLRMHAHVYTQLYRSGVPVGRKGEPSPAATFVMAMMTTTGLG